jgi:predicted transporter
MARKIFLLIGCLYLALPARIWAQADDAQRRYTAFDMRQNGKIYVVVCVMSIILVGLFLYLFRLDRKIGRLEKHNS